jgi:hypothetical protein
MFVARYVIDQLPSPGDLYTIELSLPVTKGYTALLRRLSYSLSIASCKVGENQWGNPKVEFAIQSINTAQVREGSSSYIGGMVIQPNLTFFWYEQNQNIFTMPAWGQRLFLALEERYVMENSYIAVSTNDYDSGDTLGLRIEYTQEKLSELETAQAIIR